MRRTILPAILLCAALAGCSSTAATSATGTPPKNSAGTTGATSASAAATAPSSGECSAVKAIVTANMPALEAGDGTVAQQAQLGQSYYEQLVQAIQANGGTDPDSAALLQDAEQLETAYTAYAAVATDPADNLSEMSTDLKAISADLTQLGTDQTGFDAGCGIPAIVPS